MGLPEITKPFETGTLKAGKTSKAGPVESGIPSEHGAIESDISMELKTIEVRDLRELGVVEPRRLYDPSRPGPRWLAHRGAGGVRDSRLIIVLAECGEQAAQEISSEGRATNVEIGSGAEPAEHVRKLAISQMGKTPVIW